MKIDISSLVQRFFDRHLDRHRPVLLGFSGGPDSLALLHLLIAYNNPKTFAIHLAHIDHGWREESAAEAKNIQAMAAELGIPVHIKRLDAPTSNKNLEDVGREGRLKFFHELCQQYGFQAVILGHHADDQAETVLKRLLEGSSLPFVKGMEAVSSFGGLKLWRPLLALPKRQILKYIGEKGLDPIYDRSNEDSRFLRARCRTNIIPGLSAEFGKEVAGSLCRIGQEAQELRDLLQDGIAPYLEKITKGPFGWCLNLSEGGPSNSLELKYLLRTVCEQMGSFLSLESLEAAYDKILQEAANCKLLTKSLQVYIDRGRVFFLPESLPELEEGMVPLEDGSRFGAWQVSVDNCGEGGERESRLGWQEVWRGEVVALLPQGKYTLGVPEGGASSLSHRWTNAKVPAFLRKAIPVVFSEGKVCHEFLTGKWMARPTKGPWIVVRLKYRS